MINIPMTSTPENEFNEGHWAEAMDRAHTLMIILSELLGDGDTYHPAITKAGLEEDVSMVYKGLFDLYQKLGVEVFGLEDGIDVSN